MYTCHAHILPTSNHSPPTSHLHLPSPHLPNPRSMSYPALLLDICPHASPSTLFDCYLTRVYTEYYLVLTVSSISTVHPVHPHLYSTNISSKPLLQCVHLPSYLCSLFSSTFPLVPPSTSILLYPHPLPSPPCLPNSPLPHSVPSGNSFLLPSRVHYINIQLAS